jgi:5'-nucleotidase
VKPAVREVLGLLLKERSLCLINVNFPNTTPRGMLWTRQAVKFYDGKIVSGKDPMGREHFWFTVTPLTATEEGTDLWAVEKGYVSITPLRLDLTNEKELAIVQARHALGPRAKPPPGADSHAEAETKPGVAAAIDAAK